MEVQGLMMSQVSSMRDRFWGHVIQAFVLTIRGQQSTVRTAEQPSCRAWAP